MLAMQSPVESIPEISESNGRVLSLFNRRWKLSTILSEFIRCEI